jgi:hypothetical protein
MDALPQPHGAPMNSASGRRLPCCQSVKRGGLGPTQNSGVPSPGDQIIIIGQFLVAYGHGTRGPTDASCTNGIHEIEARPPANQIYGCSGSSFQLRVAHQTLT